MTPTTRMAAAALLLLAAGALARAETPTPRVPNPQAERRLRDRERWQRAILASREATREQKAESWGELANLYHAYALLSAAAPAYEKAQTLAPRDFRWPYYLGQLHRANSENEKSLASFRRAAQLAPRDVPSQVRLGEVLLDQGRLEEAQGPLGRALALDPRCAAAHFSLGVLANATGDHAGAAEHFAAALAIQPEATAIHHPLGLAYRDLGRGEEASAELARAGTVQVTLLDPLMARLYGLVEGRQKALSEGDQALAEGKAAEAVKAYETAVADDPLDAQSRVRLGAALLRAGGAEGATAARRQLDLALRLSPDDPDARFNLGYLLLAEGRKEEAIASFRAGLAARPEEEWARFNLAGALRESGRPEEAAQEYAALRERNPKNVLAWLGEATARLQQGRCAEAKATVESGLARLPRDGSLTQALARLLAACPGEGVRDGAKALELASALQEARPCPEHADAVAMALAETGRFAQAAEQEKRAIAQAETGGKATLLPELRANLELFSANRPSRQPWPPDRMSILTLTER